MWRSFLPDRNSSPQDSDQAGKRRHTSHPVAGHHIVNSTAKRPRLYSINNHNQRNGGLQLLLYLGESRRLLIVYSTRKLRVAISIHQERKNPSNNPQKNCIFTFFSRRQGILIGEGILRGWYILRSKVSCSQQPNNPLKKYQISIRKLSIESSFKLQWGNFYAIRRATWWQ